MNWFRNLFRSSPAHTGRNTTHASTFAGYASDRNLTPDEIYTIELLIERVRDKFDPRHWDKWMERNDARETPGYAPAFSPAHLSPAEKELPQLEWMSFQRLRDAERPVRDITALRYLTKITGLVLINNEVTDLSPLQSCTALRRLCLNKNPIRDLSPLESCRELETLELGDTPILDLAPLQHLPKLRTLSLSIDQLDRFRRIDRLPTLQTLELGMETFDSFEDFPEMPELRVIRGPHVRRLAGLERFQKLENLINLSGEFESLEPLREVKQLTHANILGSRIRSVAPLSRLWALRDLCIHTESPELDLKPLEGLPALHELVVKCAGAEPADLARLRATFPSWDVEFRAQSSRYTPSLDLQIVNQKTFDLHDGKLPYNLTDSDTNAALLGSELGWLDEQLESLLSSDFTTGEDFEIPFNWGGARSRTVVLQSEATVAAFPRLALGIQAILASAQNDWIIYLQSLETEPEFVVWVYPEKLMVSESHEKAVRNLLSCA